MTKFIKGALLHATFAASILMFASCDNNNTTDTKEVAEDRNDESLDNRKQKSDAQFLVNAAEMNLEEIQLGKLAQQRGTSTQVKELGKMMEEAHTKSLAELKALAQSKRISIPTSATQDSRDNYDDMNDKTGEDFDKAYADKMVNTHEDSIDLYEDAASDSNDQEIRQWASNALPQLRTHLDHAKNTQQQTADMYLQDNNRNNNNNMNRGSNTGTNSNTGTGSGTNSNDSRNNNRNN